MTTKRPINEGVVRGSVKEQKGIAQDGGLTSKPLTPRPPPPPPPKKRT